jgi:hypothetical protein
VLFDARSQRAEAAEVQIHGAGANRTTSRKGNHRSTQAAHEWTEDEERSPHLPDRVRARLGHQRTVLRDGNAAAVSYHPFAQRAEREQDRADITQLGNSVNDHGLVGQESGDARRERGVLRSLDMNAPLELVPSLNLENVHE